MQPTVLPDGERVRMERKDVLFSQSRLVSRPLLATPCLHPLLLQLAIFSTAQSTILATKVCVDLKPGLAGDGLLD